MRCRRCCLGVARECLVAGTHVGDVIGEVLFVVGVELEAESVVLFEVGKQRRAATEQKNGKWAERVFLLANWVNAVDITAVIGDLLRRNVGSGWLLEICFFR